LAEGIALVGGIDGDRADGALLGVGRQGRGGGQKEEEKRGAKGHEKTL
jgi:hypothetical protein